MPPADVSYRPSRVTQTILIAILLVAFVISSALLVVLWPLDPNQIDNITGRALLFNMKGLLVVILAASVTFTVVCLPILLTMMLRNRPAFTLTVGGIDLNGVLIQWEEIDEIHEYVDRGTPAPLQQVVIGLYLRDMEATRAKLGAGGRWQMGVNVKKGFPPIVLATHHLQESTEEIVDAIEAYLEHLREQNQGRELPAVYRRKD
jgi:hypothetical protein